VCWLWEAAPAGGLNVIANEVALETGAMLDVSGNLRGGLMNVGGSFQGNSGRDFCATRCRPPWRKESFRTRISAFGNAGQVVVIWSDGTTGFSGAISARALGYRAVEEG